MSELCELCKDSDATVFDRCADCFWEEDSQLKRKRRLDPLWLFQRRYSALIQIENKTPDEAWILTMQGWIRYHIRIHLGMSHENAAQWMC